jgi:integrase
VAQALERYWHHHAKALPSAEQARIASALLVEHLGNATVAELTPQRQQQLVADLTGPGRSGGYVSRVLSVLRAAVNRAHKHGEVTSAPFTLDVARGEPRDRVATAGEITAFWRAIQDEHLRVFTALLLNTGGRPQMLLKLTRWNVDLERRLLDLHPRGAARTKKRNPVLPITDCLLPWLRAGHGEHLVSWRGRPIDDIKSAWRRTRARAGLPPELTPYVLRHTLATELRSRGVPEWECAGWLGHRTMYRTTEVYAKYRPDYLMQGRAAVDAWMEEIGALLEQRPGHPETPVRVRNVLGLSPRPAKTLKVVGAAGIEPAAPTMST